MSIDENLRSLKVWTQHLNLTGFTELNIAKMKYLAGLAQIQPQELVQMKTLKRSDEVKSA